METAFPFQVNQDDEWLDAQLIESNDHDNKAFWVVDNGGQWHRTEVIPRGAGAGHFRDRQ